MSTLGLLAGLYEFPTSVNVSKSMTPVAQAAVPAKFLSKLVQDGSLLKTTPKNQKRVRDDPVQTEKLTISSIQPVGDVLHVFSHIKKTYRVQRVILEGGANPPATLLGVSLHDERPLKKIKKEKGAVKDDNVTAMHVPSGPTAVWVPLDKVVETK
jgi:A/G-specific adenine glycosylase